MTTENSNTEAFKTTARHEFHLAGDVSKNQKLFSVNPDIPLDDAINSASALLSSALNALETVGMGNEPLDVDMAWLVHHQVESAKAVIDSL